MPDIVGKLLHQNLHRYTEREQVNNVQNMKQPTKIYFINRTFIVKKNVASNFKNCYVKFCPLAGSNSIIALKLFCSFENNFIFSHTLLFYLHDYSEKRFSLLHTAYPVFFFFFIILNISANHCTGFVFLRNRFFSFR